MRKADIPPTDDITEFVLIILIPLVPLIKIRSIILYYYQFSLSLH